ncbi:MAG TPA: hypothetical protein VGB53_13535 [Rubricoccaceae bacterium]
MGARESNAGDEFHLLWAARRAAALLDTSATLTKLYVEKLSDEDDLSGDDRLLTADVTEYYGGDAMDEAYRIDVIQLKYSTRAPGRAWTAARLAEGANLGKRGRNKSLVHRLSDAVDFAIEKIGMDATLERLRVRLVSNQPADKSLARAVGAAAALKARTMAAVLKGLERDEAALIGSLYKASEQKSLVFAAFLRCLDLTECGEVPRVTLRGRLVQALSSYAPANPMRAADALVQLVHSEVLPEGERSDGIDRERVLAVLGASSLDVLFPAPAQFDDVKWPIETDDVRRVVEAVVCAPSRTVVIHGDAGVGKTTTGLLMDEHLPEGSVLVPYDCFGGGDYLNAGAQRHTVRRGLRQLINELAVRCGTPYLVVDEMKLPDLERHFVGVLSEAAAAVSERGGLLVLLIDAADNAAYAGGINGDCVVPRLWAVAVPEAARLVMSARTHRLHLIAPPEGAARVLLTGFDADASAEHLRREYPDADDEAAALFHSETQGNPRVQGYVLDAGGSLDDALAGAGRTPTDLFEEIYKAAVAQAKDPAYALNHAAALLALVRPGGTDVLAEVENLTQDEADAFCRGLVPGVRVEAGGDDVRVAFKDEDFERYLVERVGVDRTTAAHDRFATWCLVHEAQDPYAARAVGDHLSAAGRLGELVALVLNDGIPTAISDDVARLEVRQRRALLALRAAPSQEDGVRVALLLAEMAREQGGFAGVVRQAPGLALRYADPGAVGRLFLRADRDREWLGPAHFHAAAVLSADPEARSAARRHLLAGQAWVQEWMREGRERGWQLETGDIVHEAIAAFRLGGMEEAVAQGSRWSPRRLRLDQAYGVGLAISVPGETVFDAMPERLGALGCAAAIAGAWAAGSVFEAGAVLHAGEALAEANRNGRHRGSWSGEWAVDFAEVLARSGALPELVRGVLEAFGPISDGYYDAYSGQGALSLRQAALCAALDGRPLALSDVLPESLRSLAALRGTGPNGSWPPNAESGEEEQTSEEEREAETRRREAVDDWWKRVGPLLKIAEVRAEALISAIDAGSVRSQLEDALAEWGRRERPYSRRYDGRWRDWLEMAVDAAGFAGADPEAVRWLDAKVEAASEVEPGAAWLSMAERASRVASFATTVLDWVGLAVRWRLANVAPVVDRRDLLLQAAQIALPFDEDYGRDLYLQALEVASELDDQGAVLLASHARLVASTASTFGTAEARALAVRLPESLDALAPRVSESSSLPYVETVWASLALSLERGFEVWARWSDDRSTHLSTPLPQAVRLVEAGGLEPEETLALLCATDTLTSETATAVLDRFGPRGEERQRRAFTRIADVVLRDEPRGVRAQMARTLTAWAEGMGVEEDRVRLCRVADFRDAPTSGESPRRENDVLGRSWTPDPEDVAAVENAASAAETEARAGTFKTLGERWDAATNGPAGIATSAFVARVAGRVRPSDRVRFLTALVTGTSSKRLARYRAEETVAAVRSQIAAWSDSRAVRDAEPHLARELVARHLSGLIGYWAQPRRAMDEVLAMLPADQRAAAVLSALPVHLVDLSVYDLYASFEVLMKLLPNDARGRVLSWSLSRRERATREGGELHERDETPEPSPEAALATFFWSLFGDRDRRVRWRTLHAARPMLTDLPLDRAQRLLGFLLDRIEDENSGDRLRSSGRLFHWHSARVSVLQLALRLSYGAPAVLEPFAERLVAVAEDRDLPHVVARELARRAVLRLAEMGHGEISEDTAERLLVTNQPVACQIESSGRSGRDPYHSGWRSDQKDDPFGFDMLDAVPYWYERLEERLVVEPGTVLDRARRWVIDRWGYRKSMWWGEISDYDDRDESRVYKGSIPAVEGARAYAEFHAMMCAAGELLDEGAEVVRSRYGDDARDPWAEWIDAYLPIRDDVWASELLSETPLDPELWDAKEPLETWLNAPDPGAFDAALGLPSGWAGEAVPEELVVRSYVNTVANDRNGDVTVGSSLVTPDTADALVRALLDVDNHDWALPDDDSQESEYGAMHELRGGRYDLTGWVSWTEREREGLDDHDPLRRGASYLLGSPGPRMTGALGLTGGPHRWTDMSGRYAFAFERWSDAPQNPDASSLLYTAGYHLRANRASLLDALRSLGRDLLLEVRIQRNESYERKRYSEGPERAYDRGRSRLYLLRRDGHLVRCEPEAGAWARDRAEPER